MFGKRFAIFGVEVPEPWLHLAPILVDVAQKTEGSCFAVLVLLIGNRVALKTQEM